MKKKQPHAVVVITIFPFFPPGHDADENDPQSTEYLHQQQQQQQETIPTLIRTHTLVCLIALHYLWLSIDKILLNELNP